MDPITIYWAGPLFSQAERMWNRMCADYLRAKGYIVTLPQDEAKKFTDDNGNVNFKALAKHCKSQASRHDIMVAILDGSDVDSGTGVEVGIRNGRGGIIIGVRTDFRASEDGHVNAMFRLVDEMIYFPSFNESHAILCDAIDEKIKSILEDLLPH